MFDIYRITMLAWTNFLGFHVKEKKFLFDQDTIIFAPYY